MPEQVSLAASGRFSHNFFLRGENNRENPIYKRRKICYNNRWVCEPPAQASDHSDGALRGKISPLGLMSDSHCLQ